MAFLTTTELREKYFEKAVHMPDNEVDQFLNMANAYAFGFIGGDPPAIPGDDRSNLKAAVALAFQLLSKGDTGQVDVITGNITESAPAGLFSRGKERDQWAIVDIMLTVYKNAYKASSGAITSDRGVRFL